MAQHGVCARCHRSFEILRDTLTCPNCKAGPLIEVDDLILPTIVELNRKGYTTQYCCSGHVSANRTATYILFDDAVFTQIERDWFLSTIPAGFSVAPKIKGYEWDLRICIRSVITGIDDKAIQLVEVAKRNLALLIWARRLPTQNYTPEQLEYIRLYRHHKLDFRGKIQTRGPEGVQIDLLRKVDGAYS